MTIKDLIDGLLNSSWLSVTIAFFIIGAIFWWLDKRLSKKKAAKQAATAPDDIKISISDVLPYKTKSDLLTKPEYTFYKALKPIIEEHAVIFSKVGLKDIFFIPKETKDYMKFWGKISQKHVDFLLCQPDTLKPICGIELDDSSHDTQKTKKRDSFVEKVYKDADFPLIRYRTKQNYTYNDIAAPLAVLFSFAVAPETKKPETLLCPKCETPFVLRTSRKDGNKFYGCSNYPNCRETAPYQEP